MANRINCLRKTDLCWLRTFLHPAPQFIAKFPEVYFPAAVTEWPEFQSIQWKPKELTFYKLIQWTPYYCLKIHLYYRHSFLFKWQSWSPSLQILVVWYLAAFDINIKWTWWESCGRRMWEEENKIVVGV